MSLLPAADAFALAVGLPTGQFTVQYPPNHMLCAFTPSSAALAVLELELPPILQIIITDDITSPAWDAGDGTEENPGKVGIFLSAFQDGWVHQATVDAWPR